MAGYVPDIIPPAALRCRDTFLTGMLEMQVRKKTLEGIDAMHFQIIQPSVHMYTCSISRARSPEAESFFRKRIM